MLDNYHITKHGVIKQNSLFSTQQVYNKEYIQNSYNTYGEKGPQLAGIRLGYLISNINKFPESILDVGYGNGDFLKICLHSIKHCYGNDISGYEHPKGSIFVENIFDKKYDVICFFDVLEHFEDINFVKHLKCNFLYISVPWCHYFSDEWFVSWKHRKPDEHLWHFNKNSLISFMEDMGFEMVKCSSIEDTIRTTTETYPNILTGIFKNIK